MIIGMEKEGHVLILAILIQYTCNKMRESWFSYSYFTMCLLGLMYS